MQKNGQDISSCHVMSDIGHQIALNKQFIRNELDDALKLGIQIIQGVSLGKGSSFYGKEGAARSVAKMSCLDLKLFSDKGWL